MYFYLFIIFIFPANEKKFPLKCHSKEKHAAAVGAGGTKACHVFSFSFFVLIFIFVNFYILFFFIKFSFTLSIYIYKSFSFFCFSAPNRANYMCDLMNSSLGLFLSFSSYSPWQKLQKIHKNNKFKIKVLTIYFYVIVLSLYL